MGPGQLPNFLRYTNAAAGFNEVRGVVNLKSSAPAADLVKLKDVVDSHCPVLDILRAPVPVDLRLETERVTQAA
jgi:putative redox protein